MREKAVNVCRALLRRRKLVVALFAVATIIGAFFYPQVKVNYNMTDYLPKDAPSVIALDDMEDAFGTGTPNARLYAEGVDLGQAEQLADDLAGVDGVDDVMWLGTAVDVRQPAAVQDEDTVSVWKTDDGYLYQLTIDTAKDAKAIAGARAAAKDNGASRVSMSGDVVSNADASASTATEMPTIMAVSIVIVLLILLLTSHSWLEPVLFIVVIGAAIMMNMGSNILLGEISFVTQICAAVLQLAVSMDYAIVLQHTFRREERNYTDPEEAMANAMVRSFSVVLSSAAVTFFGFLSLTVMRFGIGVNMGIVLAKGIIFSFLTVMFMMPCLTLLLLKPLNALQHRYLLPSFGKFAKVCTRVMLPASLVVILAAVPSYIMQDKTEFIYGSSDMVQPGSSVYAEQQRINKAFGSNETWVAMVPEGQWSSEQATIDDIDKLDHVDSVTSYITAAGRALPTEVVPESTSKQVLADGWSRIVISLDVKSESDTAYRMVDAVRNVLADHYGDDYRLVGATVSIADLRDTVQQDTPKVRAVSMGSIALILALMFRSIIIPVVVLLAIEVSIWMNLAVPFLTGQTLNYIGYLVIDAVQLGAAVDYAIIFAREYFDWRAKQPAKQAARSAVEHSAVTILTSATILICAGLAVHTVSSNGVVAELGTLIARGGFLAMVMMFVFLPWLFVVFDKPIQRLTSGLRFYTK